MLITVGGLDPSLRNFGLAKATYNTETDELAATNIRLQQTEKQSGKTVRSSSDDLRCAGVMSNAMHLWISDCAAVFAEVPSGAQSARAAFGLGIAVGVLGSVGNVGTFRGRLIQVSPQQVKYDAVGSKVAAKEEMIEWAMEKWPKLPWLMRAGKPVAKNEHMADALATIHSGVQTDEFKSIVQIVRMASIQPATLSQEEYPPTF
jgi:hypothetical protein